MLKVFHRFSMTQLSIFVAILIVSLVSLVLFDEDAESVPTQQQVISEPERGGQYRSENFNLSDVDVSTTQ
jgi:hypothetical protein